MKNNNLNYFPAYMAVFGNIYEDTGNYDEAMKCYKKQLSICEKQGIHSGICIAIYNI